ncbi:MAG: serpin family protein [Candidatus Aminicenantes bacterium]|nr:serpin family protein [Candidatus Aminicenantes bacterium]
MNKGRLGKVLLCSLFFGAGANISGRAVTPEDQPDRLISGYTRFGIGLFSDIFGGEPEKNIFLSPSSVAVALAMTSSGAAGATEEAMASVLGFAGMDRDEVFRANASLMDSLENLDPEIQLEIANSLWSREGTAFRPEFLQTNRDFFRAEVTALDFSRPEAPETINDWVGRKTHQRIQKIVDKIDPLSILFLMNAIYFKGKWTEEFDPARTNDLPFHAAGERPKNVPMMSRHGKFQYLEGDDFQAVKLPYGKRRVSLTVFLPANDSSLKAFVQKLDLDNWNRWRSEFEQAEGEVILPKFKIGYEKSLNEPLMRLGMTIAFDSEQADFGRMCETPPVVYINEVKHKSYVDVNEEGTEAAAVTAVEMRVASAPPPRKTFRMVVDRPFLFAIQDDRTGLLLFLGSIADPQPDK